MGFSLLTVRGLWRRLDEVCRALWLWHCRFLRAAATATTVTQRWHLQSAAGAELAEATSVRTRAARKCTHAPHPFLGARGVPWTALLASRRCCAQGGSATTTQIEASFRGVRAKIPRRSESPPEGRCHPGASGAAVPLRPSARPRPRLPCVSRAELPLAARPGRARGAAARPTRLRQARVAAGRHARRGGTCGGDSDCCVAPPPAAGGGFTPSICRSPIPVTSRVMRLVLVRGKTTN